MELVSFDKLEPSQCFTVKRGDQVVYLMKISMPTATDEYAVDLRTGRTHRISPWQLTMPIDVEMSFEV